MATEGQRFYSTSTRRGFTRQDVLAGHVIKLSPALITITDGRSNVITPDDLRQEVCDQVIRLLDHGVRSFHLDINFDDYSGFGSAGPDRNAALFTPDFVERLNTLVRERDAFLTLHLLTDFPAHHLRDFEAIPLGAICFQLDGIADSGQLAGLVQQILEMGACASPVIETVGTDRLIPRPANEVRSLLAPVLSQIGMLTFQAAGTASRSNQTVGTFAPERVAAYLGLLKTDFGGTIQLQGGITTQTIGAAVRSGAEFLVCGTQLFHHPDGLTPPQVSDGMLREAARVLDG
jgi:pentose-5-phosphate-3-epimerase